MTSLPLIDLTLARALNLFSLPIWSTSYHIVRSRQNQDERRPAALRLSAGSPKVTFTADFVNLVDEKWSGEVKLEGYSPPFPCLTVVGRERGAGTSSTQIV